MRNKFSLAILFTALTLPVWSADDNPNDIPDDTLENFPRRYERFIEKNEYKPMKPLYKELEKINDRYNKRVKDLTKRHADLEKKLSGAPEDQKEKLSNETKATAAELSNLLAERDAIKAPVTAKLEELVKAFWLAKDSDPATPENDYKDIVDERINQINAEIFFQDTRTTGLMFRNNGGFRGEMARVYLLHGEPSAISVLDRENKFVNMMLWLYADEVESGSFVRYAFLFYQPGNAGLYQLFDQDRAQGDLCWAVNEVMTFKDNSLMRNMACPTHIQIAYRELYMAIANDGTPGSVFLWALTNFSQDISAKLGNALQPPLPGKEAARRSGSRVVGEAPKPEEGAPVVESIASSCKDGCNSMIPAELLGYGMTLWITRQNIDWLVGENGQLTAEIKYRIVLENSENAKSKPVIFEKRIKISSSKDYLTTEPTGRLEAQLLSDDEMNSIPAGNYRVSVFIKNTHTHKFNAWVVEQFIKQ